MKKIAVISAYPNNNNPGMITSDLAFPSFCKKYLFKDFDIERYCIEKNLILNSKLDSLKLNYHKLSNPNEQLANYDLIFYWGDFLHSKNYMNSVDKRIKRENPGLSTKNIKDHVYRTLLLEHVDTNIINKTILFGSVIFTNQDSIDSERYFSALSYLYNNCKFYSHRDPLSNFIASNYSNKVSNCVGVDCAFYLDGVIGENNLTSNNFMGYSFGRRTRGKWRKGLIKMFTEYVSKDSKVKEVINIDWLNNDFSNPVDFTYDKIDSIRKCDFIITDTYHCAVNSWRVGVPAFLIGLGESKPYNSINDKKKELLYGMFQAFKFYLFVEEIQNILKWAKIKTHIYETLNDKKYITNIRNRIKNAMDKVGYDLKKELDK